MLETGALRLVWSPAGDMIAALGHTFTPPSLKVFLFSVSGHRVAAHEWAGYGHPLFAWSPDSQMFAAGPYGQIVVRTWYRDGGVRWIVGPASEDATGVFGGDVAWTPDGRCLVVAGGAAIRVYDVSRQRQTNVVEMHHGTVSELAFSFDGRWLACMCGDVVRILRVGTWIDVGGITRSKNWHRTRRASIDRTIAFHPHELLLAVSNDDTKSVDIWELDPEILAARAGTLAGSRYANAKVVLLGDSGVGKSGLGLVLSGQPFAATESTHGRRIWLFEKQELSVPEGGSEFREVLLWDLAGQPGYRLVHQLHLEEVALAIVVFDAKSEIDPFAGIRYWARALRQAARLQAGGFRTVVWLVAARVDRGSVGVSQERIQALVAELGFDGYLETSAKEGLNVHQLRQIIRKAIPWDTLPRLRSTDLFQAVRTFILREKGRGRLLSNIGDLLAQFTNQEFEREQAPASGGSAAAAALRGADVLRGSVAEADRDLAEVMRRVFTICIGRLESSGLVRRLSFGNLVILQPELLDAYASAMVNAARSEPDGLGSLNAEDAVHGRFAIPSDERLADKEDERLLLIATVEDLIRHEIALKEQADDGPHLVFPSQLTRDIPAAADNADRAVVLAFEGAVVNVYATLVVRLSYSGRFAKRQMWKNGVTFEATPRGTCSLMLREREEGAGEVEIAYADAPSEETRLHFERYVAAHLEKRAIAGSVRRRTIFRCPGCLTPVSELQANRRRERGFDTMTCGVCDGAITLREDAPAARPQEPSMIASMDRRADATRDASAASLVLAGKRKLGEFDVFLCHNSHDKDAVKRIGDKLKDRGILPWLDEWELRPGLPWQRALEAQIAQIKAAAVFVGPNGFGPWQEPELDAFLRQFIKRACPVIPVLLADAPSQPKLPVFLEAMTWVDYRKHEPDPFDRLVWGITGDR